MNRKVRVWDFVLIAVLVLACTAVWWFPSGEGITATVSVDGKIVAVLPLSEDTSLELEDGTVLTVRDGEIFVETFRCPDGLCRDMGRISKEGQTILCLPNRISVVITGEVDAYVG
jgi:hypothetical protein